MLMTKRASEMGGLVVQLLGVAQGVSANSSDPSTKVGCCIFPVDQLDAEGGSVMDCGFNVFLGLADPETATREERYAAVMHAEMTALLSIGKRARGALVVCTHEPCVDCWKALAFCGVGEVIFVQTTSDRRERWKCQEGRDLFLRILPNAHVTEVIL